MEKSDGRKLNSKDTTKKGKFWTQKVKRARERAAITDQASKVRGS